MNFRFHTTSLEDLYVHGKGKEKYPESVFRGFFKKVQSIKHAKDEGDLRAIKGNHFEKIKGQSNLYSMRINDGYRLEFSIEEKDGCNEIVIRAISNHYS